LRYFSLSGSPSEEECSWIREEVRSPARALTANGIFDSITPLPPSWIRRFLLIEARRKANLGSLQNKKSIISMVEYVGRQDNSGAWNLLPEDSPFLMGWLQNLP
jgi:hypothetical protein